MNNLSPKYPTLTEAATGLGLNTSDLCAEHDEFPRRRRRLHEQGRWECCNQYKRLRNKIQETMIEFQTIQVDKACIMAMFSDRSWIRESACFCQEV